MSFLSEPWFYGVIGFITGCTLFILAITGAIYGRWGVYGPIVSVKSVPLRIAFFCISIAIFAVLIWMIRHQVAVAMQDVRQTS